MHICAWLPDTQTHTHTGWVDGTVNLLSFFISDSSLGYYAAVRGTTYTSGHRVL